MAEGTYKKKASTKEDTRLPCCKLTEMDSKDPSYTNLVLPYRVICRQRYRREGQKQKAQFIREIKTHELLQMKALDGVKIHRIFCKATSKPKSRELVKITQSQMMKIEDILKTNY